ncbi:YciI family protein [Rhizobium sp. P38BS-XIX]|uniref:YciI family protein n=1 Tax=Rhizobium sp. P38BS-XIX TaxID=2726740 RepID=UPI001456CEC1|nr:YciI family protein [Rhizobium sp. P38BS-XIX]NLR98839.1 YciI family protein [Rhizobium sp. P38BS-XIX]
MYFAILAYHEEDIVESWSKEEDTALMTELLAINDRMIAQKSLGPAARLGATQNAVTLRGRGAGLVVDGPFAETKEQLLGFYIVDFPTIEGAIEAARDLRRANPTAVYEIRPVALYLPGASLPKGEGN